MRFSFTLSLLTLLFCVAANVSDQDSFDLDLSAKDEVGTRKFWSTLRQLNTLYANLNHQMSWSGFRFDVFETEAPKLQTQLNHMMEFVSALNSTYLSNRLSLIQLIFQDMKTAVNLSKSFSYLKKAEIALFRNVLSLNVNLYMLRDSGGYPKRLYQNDLVLLKSFASALETWVGDFEDLSEVPVALRIAFHSQVNQARETFKDFI